MLTLLRPFRRQPLFAAINLIGLAIGLAGFLFVALYVRGETAVDRVFAEPDRLYRLANTLNLPGRPPFILRDSAPQVAALLAQDFPEVATVARLALEPAGLRRDADTLRVDMAWADPGILSVLDFPLAQGNAGTALSRPDGLILAPDLAARLFGGDDPMGRTVTLEDGAVLTVTGVFARMPAESHLAFEAMAADAARGAASFDRRPPEAWSQGGAITYLRLARGADVEAMRARLGAFVAARATGLPPPEIMPNFLVLRLDRVSDIYLRAAAMNEGRSGDARILSVLVGVALLILGIAVVNYANLATALAVQRAKEVGVRKVSGARRRHLVAQFLGESIGMATAATLLAVALVELLMPAFNGLVDRSLSIRGILTPELAPLLVATPVAVGLLGGLYPAFVLSGFRPAAVLKGRQGAPAANRLGAVLVVAQFAVSIALVIATVIILRQVEHARTAELGYATDQLVVVANLPSDTARLGTLRAELEAYSGFTSVTFSTIVPSQRSESVSSVEVIGRDLPPEQAPMVSQWDIALNFLATYDIPLIAGSGPPPGWSPAESRIDPEDGQPVQAAAPYLILSEEAVRRIGLGTPEQAVGAQLAIGPDGRQYPSTVVGVVGDLRFRTARHAAEALVLAFADVSHYVTVRLGAGDPRAHLETLDRTVAALFPEVNEVRRLFVDEQLERQYRAELRQAHVFATFAALAILLANMGLFGLTALAAARRTKEIGIRRVVGASMTDVVRLLAWQFARPVLIANLLAWPVAWWLMMRWLEQYTVRIDPGPAPFLLAGGMALAVALAVVAVHALRVALAPPVRALRYE